MWRSWHVWSKEWVFISLWHSLTLWEWRDKWKIWLDDFIHLTFRPLRFHQGPKPCLVVSFTTDGNSILFSSGIFTVAGIVDSFVYHGQKALKKKVEIGKFIWSDTIKIKIAQTLRLAVGWRYIKGKHFCFWGVLLIRPTLVI